MWDLDTMYSMNERAYEEYQRKEPTTMLEALRERLHKVRPPSISILLSLFRNAETYNDFVKLVREYLPEREKEILAEATPSAQMACFASHFEDRYLPLHPAFKDGQMEDDYSALLHDIPIVVMGFGWEDYHSLNDARLGLQLMSYLFEPPFGDEDQVGERLALVDGFSPEYQREAQRLPAGGISLDDAKRILKGKKWAGLRLWAEYINMATGNWFLDTDDEMLSQMINDWDKETVEAMSKEWRLTEDLQAKFLDFAAWLEYGKEGPARFKETVDFLLAHLEPKGDVNVERAN